MCIRDRVVHYRHDQPVKHNRRTADDIQNKKPAFTAEERVEFLKRTTADLPNVEVESFGGLLADYAKQKNA